MSNSASRSKTGNQTVRQIVFSALFLAIGQVLPLVTAHIPAIAKMISPMHIPAFLCGFVCGPIWGAVVGFVCPLLRMLLFGMPAFPMALYMAFELCTYGLCAGILYRVFPKKVPYLYLNLVISMIVGRIVYCAVFAAFSGSVAGVPAFFLLLGTQFVNTWAGILIHLAIIPPIVLALKKAGLMANE
ncbi:MAG: ECF transporter S component [Clostridia bacterium]|nr:ECF transporter S component [Clostridia bacterium]MBR5367120.1 ECF transporter S component [Clostridia bacterium]